MLTKGTRHELNEVTLTEDVDQYIYAKNFNHSDPKSFEPMTIHERNFRHFMFAAAVSGLVIGIYTFAGAGGKAAPTNNK